MHKHHVIPKYRDPSSAVTVTITPTQHAMFHWCNWQLWRNDKDWLAWKGLSEQIGREEIFIERSSIGGRLNAGKAKTAEHRRKISDGVKQSHARSPRSQEVKDQISRSMVGNSNSQSQKSAESRKRHREIMKAVWARRKAQSGN